MLNPKTKISLSRKNMPIYNIWHYAVIIIVLASLLIAALSYSIYTSHTHNENRELSLKALTIEKIFSELLEETNRILAYAGRQIARLNKAKDLNSITKFLDQAWESDFKAKPCITFIEWLDNKNMQLVNSQIGVIPTPTDMSFRLHTKECRKKPWQLQVSPPDIGIPSGLWVIPAGIGITDEEKGIFLGMLVVGISVAAITSKVVDFAQADQTSFIIIDTDGKVILQTEDNEADTKAVFHPEVISELLTMPKQGFLKNPFLHNKISYRFYTKMNNLPYVILVGRHSTLSKRNFYALVLPRILEFSLIPIFCLFLLYLFKKHLIQISKLSYKAREKFLHTFNEDFFILSEIILRRLRIFLKTSISDPSKLCIIERIYKDVIQLKQLSTSNTNIVSVNVNKALEESVLVISQLAFLQNKKIIYEFQDDIPNFNTEKPRFTQIILSLLSIAMEGTRDGCEILIRTYVEDTNHNKQLIIQIIDNGFGLSSFEIKKLRDSHRFSSSHHFNGTELDIQEIIQFVEIHGGRFQESSTPQKGLNIRLTLPYQERKEADLKSERKSNVYKFTQKS